VPVARYYNSEEAVKRLGVSRNTLYVYVCRGLVRSEPGSPGRRNRRYRAEDVDRLARQQKVRKTLQVAVDVPVERGGPIIDTTITLVTDDAFFYRGQSALALADQGSFEKTLAVLWEPAGSNFDHPGAYVCDLIEEHLRLAPRSQSPVESFLALLGILNARDVKVFALTPEVTAQAGLVMLDGLSRILTGHWRQKDLAGHLAKHWGVEPGSSRLLSAALTLVADHELDMSAFVARCAAAAGCSPYAAVAAATRTFSGRRDEGNIESVKGLLSEAEKQGSLYEVIVSRVRRGDPVPGFGMRGEVIDPRTDYLLCNLPDRQGYIRQALAAAKELLSGAFPSIDFALQMTERDLSLPPQSGFHLCYLGRIAGWVAHIMAQYGQGQSVLPRARYVGRSPTNPLAL